MSDNQYSHNSRVVYLTQEGFDTPNPNNYMALLTIKGLLEKNIELLLIQTSRRGKDLSIPNELVGFSQLNVINIHRARLQKSKFVLRFFDGVWFSIKAYCQILRQSKNIVYYIQSYPTVFVLLFLMGKKRRMSTVLNIYDIFPGHAYDIGVIKSKKLYRILLYLSNYGYSKVKRVIVLSEDMKKTLTNYNVNEQKISVVAPFYDISWMNKSNLSYNRFVKEHLIDSSKFIIQYAGSIGQVFDVEFMVNFAKSVSDNSNIQIHIIGDGALLGKFKTEISLNKLSNVIFFPWQTRDHLLEVYSYPNLAIVPLKRGVIRAGYPSKLANLFANSVPTVVAIECGTIMEAQLSDIGALLFVRNDMHGVNELGVIVKSAINNPKLLSKFGNTGYNYARELMNSDYCVSQITTIIGDLL